MNTYTTEEKRPLFNTAPLAVIKGISNMIKMSWGLRLTWPFLSHTKPELRKKNEKTKHFYPIYEQAVRKRTPSESFRKVFNLLLCRRKSRNKFHTKLHTHQVALLHYALTTAPLWKCTQRSFISCNVKRSLRYKLIFFFREKHATHPTPRKTGWHTPLQL